MKMFRQKNYLPNVISIVHQLPVDGLRHRMLFAANHHFRHQVVWTERLERGEHTLPASLPVIANVFGGGVWSHYEFHVSIAIRFLAVRRQEVCPAREHV